MKADITGVATDDIITSEIRADMSKTVRGRQILAESDRMDAEIVELERTFDRLKNIRIALIFSCVIFLIMMLMLTFILFEH